MSGFNQSVCKYVFVITVFAAGLLAAMGTICCPRTKGSGPRREPRLRVSRNDPARTNSDFSSKLKFRRPDAFHNRCASETSRTRFFC